MKIAFDVDGTLIRKSATGDDVPRYEIIILLALFSDNQHEVYVWSGSGVDYAERWCEKLGLKREIFKIVAKGSFVPDVAIDDEEVELGKTNIKV